MVPPPSHIAVYPARNEFAAMIAWPWVVVPGNDVAEQPPLVAQVVVQDCPVTPSVQNTGGGDRD